MITGRPKIFRDAEIRMDCDVCRAHFDIIKGGVCTRCRRVLCGRHLYGSWTRRLIAEVTGRTLCPECRHA